MKINKLSIKTNIEERSFSLNDNIINFICTIEPEFVEYVSDLLEYGLSQYSARYTNDEDFLLYQDYRQDQALLKILENPKHNQYVRNT